MQYQRRSIRKARAIRTKAFFITLLFHLALIGYFTYGTDLSLQDYLPETVAEWVGGGGESEGGSEEVEPPRP
ncbi:MAG TPA: hypothetical protein VJ933_12130 [Phaeodactylibacter sp.]|nr:hypothetical protein [Phaeodactylibacter sp.]